MKKLALVLVLIFAGAAVAGPIYDVQTGVYTIGDLVVVEDAIVTGVMYNGVFISEDVGGPYTGVWVYTDDDPGVAVGDLVDVAGEYKEYYDLTEIDVDAAGDDGYLIFDSVHTGQLAAVPVTIPQLNADPEPWEGCYVFVISGMVVTDITLGFGEWEVEAWGFPGEFMRMDDYWYDFDTVVEGDCYCGAVGIYHYGYGNYKLEPFADAICHMDCAIANEDMSFGDVKAMYR